MVWYHQRLYGRWWLATHNVAHHRNDAFAPPVCTRHSRVRVDSFHPHVGLITPASDPLPSGCICFVGCRCRELWRRQGGSRNDGGTAPILKWAVCRVWRKLGTWSCKEHSSNCRKQGCLSNRIEKQRKRHQLDDSKHRILALHSSCQMCNEKMWLSKKILFSFTGFHHKWSLRTGKVSAVNCFGLGSEADRKACIKQISWRCLVACCPNQEVTLCSSIHHGAIPRTVFRPS